MGLMTWGDKMTKAEIDDIFGEFEIDEDYMIKTKEVVGLFVAVKEEEKKVEEAPPPVEEAPVEEEEEEEEEEGCQVNSWLHDDLDPSYPCPPGQAPAKPHSLHQICRSRSWGKQGREKLLHSLFRVLYCTDNYFLGRS